MKGTNGGMMSVFRGISLSLSVILILSACGSGGSSEGKSDASTNKLALPPWETFVRAEPGAATDIDLETLNGQTKVPAQTLPTYQTALAGQAVAPDSSDETKGVTGSLPDKLQKIGQISQPIKDEEKTPVPEDTQGGKAVPVQEKEGDNKNAVAKLASPGVEKQPEAKEDASKTVIKAVAVLPVQGSTASGDAELTKAMRQTLTTAGWTVLDHSSETALTIEGKISIAAASGSKQKISLEWLVKTPQGETLGNIKQVNDVDAGSLDKGWGDTAVAVTEAAATGIFELVNKLR